MNYTGCLGNANRFMSKEECDNACLHESKLVRAKIVCSMPRSIGIGTEKLAKWYFDSYNKVCSPFYYSGNGGNENNFESWDECEQKCPNTFPPEIQLSAKVRYVLLRKIKNSQKSVKNCPRLSKVNKIYQK